MVGGVRCGSGCAIESSTPSTPSFVAVVASTRLFEAVSSPAFSTVSSGLAVSLLAFEGTTSFSILFSVIVRKY